MGGGERESSKDKEIRLEMLIRARPGRPCWPKLGAFPKGHQ